MSSSPQTLALATADQRVLADLLRRVLRLDPKAVVRLRAEGSATALWTQVLNVLSAVPLPVAEPDPTSRATGAGSGASTPGHHPDVVWDRAVDAAPLLAACSATASTVSMPPAVDRHWRGELPPTDGWQLLDDVPGAVLSDLVRAGVDTFRSVAPTAALPDRVGTALLDHRALTVSGPAGAVEVPLRVPQALVRLGVLDVAGTYAVEVTPTWYRLRHPAGTAYRRRTTALTLTPVR